MATELTTAEDNEQEPMPFATRAKYLAGAGLASGTLLELMGAGGLGLLLAGVVGGGAAVFAPELQEMLPRLPMPARHAARSRGAVDWLFSRPDAPARDTDELPAPIEEARPVSDYHTATGDLFARAASRANVSPVRRLTIEEIAAHTDRNSYTAWIGRSLTERGNPGICINFYKRHIKLIGASQKGKSSMAGAFLDMVTRTHDREHVLVALLDLEDRTGRLFEDIPHLMKVPVNGELVTLHARTSDQVLLYLNYLNRVLSYRYRLPVTEVNKLPVILIYLEEFLALKDEFKARIAQTSGEAQVQAKTEYANLVFYIKQLARLGLKAKMQLLMCAQVDYRDDDLQEALINVTSGFSFCVRVSAAQAAGFMQTELLNQNARDNIVGQAVVEMPDCRDLVLAPEYDLEARLVALEERSQEQAGTFPGTGRNTGTQRNGEEQPVEPMGTGYERSCGNEEHAVPERGEATPQEREQIISFRKAGVPRREICGKMEKGKYFYEIVKYVCDEEGL